MARWFGRLYVGLACLELIGVTVQLVIGNLAMALRSAGFMLGFGLLGAVILGAARLDWSVGISVEARRSRQLTAPTVDESRLRWTIAAVVVVQFVAMGFVVYLLLAHR